MKILLTGSKGLLGADLNQALQPLGEVTATTRETLDLTNLEQLTAFILDLKPDYVVNTAAYTNVNAAEKDHDIAMQVNARAPEVIARICKHLDSVFIHFSTDYVFDGEKKTPYTEDDTPHPINIYGSTKLLGEQAISAVGGRYLIFRTAWLFNAEGNNFLQMLQQFSESQEVVKVANDQIGSPTSSKIVSEITTKIMTQREHQWGIYHLAGSGEASRYELACEYFREHPEIILKPVPGSTFPTTAKRPAYTPFSCKKLERAYNLKIPTWQEMVHQRL